MLVCGRKVVAALKPDHVASQMRIEIAKECRAPTVTGSLEVASLYAGAKAGHSGAWTRALVAKDLEKPWLLHQVLPTPDDEAVAAAKQHATVTDVKRKLLDSGSVASLEWPTFLGTHPPTPEAQHHALNAWVSAGTSSRVNERLRPCD
eukprot:2139008-Amphidinium_carterae.1